ncbi:MAG: hypothetical protein ACYTG0_17990 [Planctomycetota bacterium]|jgi:hypothetical protein
MMKGTCFVLLRLLLLAICLTHLVIGVGVNVSPDFPKAVAPWYGATKVVWSPQFSYILRPIGAYMIVMSFLAAVAVADPRKHSAIVYGLALLLVFRGIQRIVFHDEIMQAFGVEAYRNLINVCFFAGLGILLFSLRLGAGSTADSEPAKT